MSRDIIAIIDIGSSSIKMNIYEIFNNDYKILESLRQHVRLGIDSFYEGKISRKTINECVLILNRYKKLCEDYQVKYLKAVATTAVREAMNVDIFIDNIFRHTDIEIELLAVEKESEYIYRAIINLMNKKGISYNNKNWCIVEIGSGNVQITMLEGNCIIVTRPLPLGISKIKQLFLKEFENSEENFLQFLDIIINNELHNLKRTVSVDKIAELFVVSTELSQMPLLFKQSSQDLQVIQTSTIKNFYNKISNYTEEELYHKVKIPHDLTDSFVPAVHLFIKIIDFFNSKHFTIPMITLTDGIINDLYYVQEEKDYFSNLEKQLKVNAINTGRSLNFDEKHAIKVLELSLKLFDETKEIHRLGNIERCYLIVAAILHDIGSSISYRSHHKHTLYIINSINFFSLNAKQINIIANVARYHRKSVPKESHPSYMQLSLFERMVVLKLSSILRIADSLDNTHLQLIDNITIEKSGDKLNINAQVKDLYLSEFYSFEFKKELFEEFFGLKLTLKKIKVK